MGHCQLCCGEKGSGRATTPGEQGGLSLHSFLQIKKRVKTARDSHFLPALLWPSTVNMSRGFGPAHKRVLCRSGARGPRGLPVRLFFGMGFLPWAQCGSRVVHLLGAFYPLPPCLCLASPNGNSNPSNAS